MFRIDLSDEALDDLRWLKKTEQVLILDPLDTFLYEPNVETRRRKPLRSRELMDLLDRRSNPSKTYSIDEARKLLGIDRPE